MLQWHNTAILCLLKDLYYFKILLIIIDLNLTIFFGTILHVWLAPWSSVTLQSFLGLVEFCEANCMMEMNEHVASIVRYPLLQHFAVQWPGNMTLLFSFNL